MDEFERLLELGRMDFEAGYPQCAREYFEKVLALDSTNPEAIDALARIDEILSRRMATPVKPIQHEPAKPSPKVATKRTGMYGLAAILVLAVVVTLVWIAYSMFFEPPREAAVAPTAAAIHTETSRSEPTNTPEPGSAFGKWNSQQVIEAFTAAGLEVGETYPFLKSDAGLVPQVFVEAIRFLIPSLCEDCGGRVFSFIRERDLETAEQYYEVVNEIAFTWVFVKDNILVQINGDLPEERARQYEVAVSAMGARPTKPPAPAATPTEIPVQRADARASAYIGGNASPPLPAGELGVPTVVAVGSYTGSILPVVLRNNTGEDVRRMTVSAVVRDADGNMLGTGGDQGFKPNLVRPGQITLGYVYFGGIDLPPDATFEFDVDAKPASEARFENIRDLDVVEQSFVEGRIVGMLQNSHDEHVSGPIGVAVFCFETEGVLLGYYHDYTDKDEADPGDTVPFQVDVRGSCPVFLVAAYGFTH